MQVSQTIFVIVSTLLIWFSLNQPAQIAGCKTIVLATPPAQDGSICKVIGLILKYYKVAMYRSLAMAHLVGGYLLC